MGNTTVVREVILLVFQVFEELDQVFCTTDGEPDGGYDRNCDRDVQTGEVELDSPPGVRPFVDTVPDYNAEEAEEEAIDERPDEYGPCQDLVALGVLSVDTDDFLEDSLESPGNLFGYRSIRIFAAVEHFFPG